MSDKLCPFCGGSECYSVDDYGDVSVACLYKTHGDTWNARPLEDALRARAEAAEAKADRYEDALQKIGNWAKAYPLDIFPEPDFKKVRAVLNVVGITLDSVSASNMRHVISGVEQIVSEALKGGEE